jgi:DNA-binding TFAR19-related protein (PDSD5 family)
MLILHYTGPKPIISQHGIFFKHGKEDKYVYLKTAVYLLLSIDKDAYRKYKGTPSEALTDQEVIDILRSYEPNLEQHISEEEKRYEAHIEEMREHARSHPLTEEERTAWLNNIEIMRPYLIQREINKLYYIHCIKAIKEIIHEERLKEIDINFSLKNWHILASIAGNLEYGVKSVHTMIKVETDKEGELIARLLINPPAELLSPTSVANIDGRH